MNAFICKPHFLPLTAGLAADFEAGLADLKSI